MVLVRARANAFCQGFVVHTAGTATSVNSGWQPLTAADASRGEAAVQSLGRQSGPVFANLTPAEAASYIFTVVAKQLPPSAKNAEAAVIGDRLYVRSEVDLKDFGGAKSLGPWECFSATGTACDSGAPSTC